MVVVVVFLVVVFLIEALAAVSDLVVVVFKDAKFGRALPLTIAVAVVVVVV